MDVLVAIAILVLLVVFTKSLIVALIYFILACLAVYAYRKAKNSR